MTKFTATNPWSPFIDAVIKASAAGDIIQELKFLTVLLTTFKDNLKDEAINEQLSEGLLRLADTYCLQNEFDKAESLYKLILEEQDLENCAPLRRETAAKIVSIQHIRNQCKSQQRA